MKFQTSIDTPVVRFLDIQKVYRPNKLSTCICCEKYKPTVAVESVSFGLSDGDCLCLLGPNGTGKTTLFKIISQ